MTDDAPELRLDLLRRAYGKQTSVGYFAIGPELDQRLVELDAPETEPQYYFYSALRPRGGVSTEAVASQVL